MLATVANTAPKVRNGRKTGFTSDLHAGSRAEDAPLEQGGRQPVPRGLQPFHALGPDPGGEEIPLGDLARVHAGLLEAEEVVHADDLPLHADDLRDLDDLADAAQEAGDLDDDVDGRGDLAADDP